MVDPELLTALDAFIARPQRRTFDDGHIGGLQIQEYWHADCCPQEASNNFRSIARRQLRLTQLTHSPQRCFYSVARTTSLTLTVASLMFRTRLLKSPLCHSPTNGNVMPRRSERLHLSRLTCYSTRGQSQTSGMTNCLLPVVRRTYSV